MFVCIKDQIQNMNLVIGCTVGCDYCYARNNVKRWHMIDDFAKPEFFPNKLRLMEKQRPQNFLLTGMSDLAVWKQEWLDKVFTRMRQNPQHQFLFLSKRPDLLNIDTDLENAWFGVTVTRRSELWRVDALRENVRAKHYHVTFEPLFDDPGKVDLQGVDWIVVGTMTGAQSRKVHTKPAWAYSLTEQAHALDIPVFMKEDLVPIIGEENMIQEMPEAYIRVLEEQEKCAETKNIMTKSSLPVGGYSVNPYVGCTHACKYCYASFMKRFTGHTEEWGTFLDVKHWPEIKNAEKYAGQRVVIGSVTDGYNPQEEKFGNTRKLLEQLRGSGADILICTKSDLVVRDIDLIKELGQVTVSWSINTLDEGFKNDMDSAVSIERRIAAMKKVYNAGIRTVCFVSPVFPGITDFEAIFERVKDQCDLFWLENLNLRGGFKKTIMDYIADRHSELIPLYDEIYNKKNRSYFEALEQKAGEMAKKYDCPFVDNEMPYGRVPQGHPVIVDYFYHEEIRGSENTGKRNK